MPAASLQARINAFESLARRSPPQPIPKSPSNLLETPISPMGSSFAFIAPFKPVSRSPSASPPVLGRKTSLIDLKDWVMDDGFSPPSHPNSFDFRWNRKPTGMNDLGVPTPSRTPDDVNKIHSVVSTSPSTILINLESPPSQPIPIRAPPLPPRKSSYNSLKSVSSSNSTSTRNGSSATPFQPVKRPANLTVEHTYPPLAKFDDADFPRKGGHAPASSISSFHSVSLSSDSGTTDGGRAANHIATFPLDREVIDADTLSLDESFEDVSTSSIASPTTAAALAFNWDLRQTPKPPKLPQRPLSKQTNTSSSLSSSPKPPPRPSSSTSSSPARRGPPPPPPPRIPSRAGSTRTSLISTTASDRSSILSTGTATTSRTSMSSMPALVHKASLARPTPVPAAARKRYESVFAANVMQQRQQVSTAKPATLSPLMAKKSRQAAGWRGLSVDLITNPENHPLNSDGKANGKAGGEGDDGKLDGYIIKLIWSMSKLEREKLRAIWIECDVSRDGALDRDAFVKGMWRIDEELRRAQTKPTSASSSSSRPRPLPKSILTKPILR